MSASWIVSIAVMRIVGGSGAGRQAAGASASAPSVSAAASIVGRCPRRVCAEERNQVPRPVTRTPRSWSPTRNRRWHAQVGCRRTRDRCAPDPAPNVVLNTVPRPWTSRLLPGLLARPRGARPSAARPGARSARRRSPPSAWRTASVAFAAAMLDDVRVVGAAVEHGLAGQLHEVAPAGERGDRVAAGHGLGEDRRGPGVMPSRRCAPPGPTRKPGDHLVEDQHACRWPPSARGPSPGTRAPAGSPRCCRGSAP